MEIQKYQRKPSYVEAVCVTEENFFDVAHWCQGAIVTPNGTVKSLDEIAATKDKHIAVRVMNPMKERHTKAFVGDWVLYSQFKGYQVYTQKAFDNAFVGPIVEPKSVEQMVEEMRQQTA